MYSLVAVEGIKLMQKYIYYVITQYCTILCLKSISYLYEEKYEGKVKTWNVNVN